MSYNEKTLRDWRCTEDLFAYLERRGVVDDESVDDDRFKKICDEYYGEIRGRIQKCKNLLKESDDFWVNLTLAYLYDRYDLENSADCFYRRPVRYYAIRAMRKNRQSAEAWLLLADCYAWLSMMGPEGKEAPSIQVQESISDMPSLRDSQKSYVEEACSFSDTQKSKIALAEKAVRCIQRACRLEPANETIRARLRHYLSQRNQEFKPEGAPRIFNLSAPGL